MKTLIISMIIGMLLGIVLSTFILTIFMKGTQDKIASDISDVKEKLIRAEISPK